MKQKILTLLLLLCSAMGVNAATETGTKTYPVDDSFTYNTTPGSQTIQQLASIMNLCFGSSNIPTGGLNPPGWASATNWQVTKTSGSSGVSYSTPGSQSNSSLIFTYPRTSNTTLTWTGYVTAEYNGTTYKANISLNIHPYLSDNDIRFTTPTVTKQLTGTSLTYTQTATSSSTATKTYSISPTTGASINSSTGQVTVTKAGTYTITCSQPALWQQTNSYDAGSATYTLVVTSVPVIQEYYSYSTSTHKRWLKSTEVLSKAGASTSTSLQTQKVESITANGITTTVTPAEYTSSESGGNPYNGIWNTINSDFTGITKSTAASKMASASSGGVETYYASLSTMPLSASSYSWLGFDIKHPATAPVEYSVQLYVSANTDGSNPYRCLYVSSPDQSKMNGVKMIDGSDWMMRRKCEFSIADLRTDGLEGATTYSVVSATAVDGTSMEEGIDYTVDATTGSVVSKKAGTFTVKSDFAGNTTTGYFPASATSTFTVKRVGDFWPVPEGFSKTSTYIENYIEACPLTFGDDIYSTVAGSNDDIDYADTPTNLRAFEYYTTGLTAANGNGTTIPTTGTYYKFSPEDNNKLLTVGIKLDKRCKFWLLDVDGSNITSRTDLGSGLETWNGVNGTVSLFTQAGHEYYFFSEGTPLSIYGYHYSANAAGYYEKHGFLTRDKNYDEE